MLACPSAVSTVVDALYEENHAAFLDTWEKKDTEMNMKEPEMLSMKKRLASEFASSVTLGKSAH